MIDENVNVPMVYSGTMNGKLFLYWLEKGTVVIMDNASIHKVSEVKKVIESAGCSLLYLPPYSPDFNPIENYWAAMKSHIKKMRDEFENIADAIDKTLQNTKRYFHACITIFAPVFDQY